LNNIDCLAVVGQPYDLICELVAGQVLSLINDD